MVAQHQMRGLRREVHNARDVVYWWVPKLSTLFYFCLFIYFSLSIFMLYSLYSNSNKNSVLYIHIYI